MKDDELIRTLRTLVAAVTTLEAKVGALMILTHVDPKKFDETTKIYAEVVGRMGAEQATEKAK